MTDGSISRVARRWRETALACLVQIVRDEGANPSARASAARDILHYSDGRPMQAEPLTSIDIEDLSDEERGSIYVSLTNYFLQHGFPPAVARMMQDSIDDEIAELEMNTPPPEFLGFKMPALLQSPSPPSIPTRRTRRVRLYDDDNPMPPSAALPSPSAPPRLRPVPGPNEYLIDLPYPIAVQLFNGRSIPLKEGYSIVTEAIATHPVVKRFVVKDAA